MIFMITENLYSTEEKEVVEFTKTLDVQVCSVLLNENPNAIRNDEDTKIY